MKDWLLPTLGALLFWGLWGFIPKLTTQFLAPSSAIVYEVVGGLLLGVVMLSRLQFQPEVHPHGIALAITTGMLGFLGAFCFLTAVSRGPVTLVATVSALYPVVSVLLAISFLHEALTLRQGAGVILALIAMILIAA
jgi:bacterial/archaeal transporter family protein